MVRELEHLDASSTYCQTKANAAAGPGKPDMVRSWNVLKDTIDGLRQRYKEDIEIAGFTTSDCYVAAQGDGPLDFEQAHVSEMPELSLEEKLAKREAQLRLMRVDLESVKLENVDLKTQLKRVTNAG